MAAPRRQPLIDPQTGLVTPEWLKYLSDVGEGGGVTSFTNVSIIRTGATSALAVSVDASTLTGTTLAPTVVNSSLTGVGTLTSGALGAGFVLGLAVVTVTGALPWANLPAGAGNWNGAPTVTGPITAGGDILPLLNYTSNLGSINTKFLAIYGAELWVETLVAADTMATIGGRILVAPTTQLTADCAPAAVTITVKHNNLLNGHRVRLEANAKVEWMAITSAASGSAGAYVYSVTRDLDGSGANQWYAGDAVLSTGTTGDGFIDLYSVSGVLSGNGPTIVGNVRTGTTYNQIEPRWAIGNLKGLYGYAATEYGVAMGVPTGAWAKLDPTNGLRFGFNTTTTVQITAAGVASFESGIAIGTNGSVTAGGVQLNASGLLISPVSAGGGGAYANDHAVRWSTSTTFRNAIWRSDDTGSLIKYFNVDAIWDGTTNILGHITITNKQTAAGGFSYGISEQQSRVEDTKAFYQTYAGSSLASSGNQALLWFWSATGITQQVSIGVGVPSNLRAASPSPPTLVSGIEFDTFGATIIGNGITITGSLDPGQIKSPKGLELNASVTIANGAWFDIPNGATALGFLIITSQEDTVTAMFLMRAGTGATVLALDPAPGVFSSTLGAGGRANVGWNVGTGAYRIENNRGLTRTFNLMLAGGTGLVP